MVHDDYFSCPHCGADVLQTATFCRECGADGRSGWNDEDSDSSGYDPGGDQDDFDYDDYLQREFPDHAPPAATGQKLGVVVIVLIILALLLSMAF